MQNFIKLIGMREMEIIPIIVRILLSIICGGILGLDRTSKRRAAGIRTYSMVCVASAAVMMTGISIQEFTGGGDASRLGAQVVSGIGFIGAGAIMVTGYHEIKGLTTAAGIWTSACLGLAIGTGYYVLALACCFISYIILHFGAVLQDQMLLKIRRIRVYVAFDNVDKITGFMLKARELDIIIQDCDYTSKQSGTLTTSAVFTMKLPVGLSHNDAIQRLMQIDGILLIDRL